MNWLRPLILLAVAGLAHSTWDNCGGTCGLRAVVSDYYPMTYYYGHVAYDYGMTRVVGGTGALPGSWPWIVSIQHPWMPDLMHLCGGTLIGTEWVLTAAHCFGKITNISMVSVVIGATQLTQPGPGAQVRSVKQLVMHDYYNPDDMSNDIALLELDHPVQCSPYIQLACLPDATLRVSELQNCWIAGWGSTAARDQQASDHLQEAKVQLIDLEICNSTHWYSGDIHTHNLCAGYPQGTIDTCQGDSGGPLLCQDNKADHWWLVGVTSWGRGCARAKRPGVYSSTQYFYDWVVAHIGANAAGNASPESQAWGNYVTPHQPAPNPWTARPPSHNPWPAAPPTHNPWPAAPTPNPWHTAAPTPKPRPATLPTPNTWHTAAPTPKPRPATLPTPNTWHTAAPTPNPWHTAAPTPKPRPATPPTPNPWHTAAPTPNPWHTAAPTPKPRPATLPTPNPWHTAAPTPNPWHTAAPIPKPRPTTPPTHKPWTVAPTPNPWHTAAPTPKPWPATPPTQKPLPTTPPTHKPPPKPAPSGEVSSCPYPINKLIDFFAEVKNLLHQVLGQNTA